MAAGSGQARGSGAALVVKHYMAALGKDARAGFATATALEL
jgi:hypothetical protein